MLERGVPKPYQKVYQFDEVYHNRIICVSDRGCWKEVLSKPYQKVYQFDEVYHNRIICVSWCIK